MTYLSIMMIVASVIVFIWLMYNKKELNSKWWELIIFTIILLITGIGSVKLFALIEGLITNRKENMSLFGALFFMPIVFFAFSKIKKINIRKTFDILSVFLCIALFFARISCIHNGCCYGKIILESSYRYPTREIELIFYFFMILIGFLNKSRKGTTPNYYYPIYLLSYGLIRFVLEFFRESNAQSIFHIAHLWSLIVIIIGIVFLFRKGEKHEI